MNSTKLEFLRFKQQINLTQYATALGYEIDKKKSTHCSITMRKGNQDKVIISKRGGSWIYFSVYDDQDNGTIIDFVKNRTNQSLFEIGQELQAWISGNIAFLRPARYAPDLKERQPDPRRIRRLFNFCSQAHNHDYLKSRRIPNKVIKSPRFVGQVFQDRFNNAVFPHFKDKQVCGLELRGENTHLFVRGSEKTLWRSNTREGDETLIISETPIDALSYQILNSLSNAFYASTSGAFSTQQGDIVRELATLSSLKSIVLITDNDEGGDAITDKLNGIITNTDYSGSLTRHSPDTRGLDWNDVLKNEIA